MQSDLSGQLLLDDRETLIELCDAVEVLWLVGRYDRARELIELFDLQGLVCMRCVTTPTDGHALWIVFGGAARGNVELCPDCAAATMMRVVARRPVRGMEL